MNFLRIHLAFVVITVALVVSWAGSKLADLACWIEGDA
jgi:hypothetical protein